MGWVEFILTFLFGAVTAVVAIVLGLYFGLHLYTKKNKKIVQSRGKLQDLIRIIEAPIETLSPDERKKREERGDDFKAALLSTFPASLKDRPYERAVHPTTKRPPYDPTMPRVRLEDFCLAGSPPTAPSITPSQPVSSSSGGSNAGSSSNVSTANSAGTVGGTPPSTSNSSIASNDSSSPSLKRPPSISASTDWQAKSGLLQVRILKEWNEMLCIVGRKRLYYCFPASAGNTRPVCIGAVRLAHIDIA